MEKLCVNIYDGDIYGSGDDYGMRYVVYVDDPELGALTGEPVTRGAVPEHLCDKYGTDDDWLWGKDAEIFLSLLALEV